MKTAFSESFTLWLVQLAYRIIWFPAWMPEQNDSVSRLCKGSLEFVRSSIPEAGWN